MFWLVARPARLHLPACQVTRSPRGSDWHLWTAWISDWDNSLQHTPVSRHQQYNYWLKTLINYLWQITFNSNLSEKAANVYDIRKGQPSFYLPKILNWAMFPIKLCFLSKPSPKESCSWARIRIPWPSFSGSRIVVNSSTATSLPSDQVCILANSVLGSRPERTRQTGYHLHNILISRPFLSS